MKTIISLLSTIVKSTEDRLLNWRLQTDTTYTTVIGRYKFSVWQWEDEGDGSIGYTATISEGGQTVDSITAGQFHPRFEAVEEVFNAARRSYHNIDAIVDNIELELKKLKNNQE